MKKTGQFIAMATLRLNVLFRKTIKKIINANRHHKNNHLDNLPYTYYMSDFKPGYPPGYRINNDYVKGKSIAVRNYTITQLFALAFGSGNKDCPSIPQERIFIEVLEPKKLDEPKCFELVVPFFMYEIFYIIMQKCLNAEFPEYIVDTESRGGVTVMVITDKAF